MSIFGNNNYNPARNDLHYTPNRSYDKTWGVEEGDSLWPDLDLFNPQGTAEFQSYQFPNYKVTGKETARDQEKLKVSRKKAYTTSRNNIADLGPDGETNQQARHFNIIRPDETLIDEFAKEISLDSKATKTGLMSEVVDALQVGLYPITGGIITLMKSGDMEEAFKQR